MKGLQNPVGSFPPFWQGVISSILAAVLVAIAVRLYIAFSRRARQSQDQRKRRLEELVLNLSAPDPVIRVEAYLRSLFMLFRYFFYACIFWALYGVLPAFAWIGSVGNAIAEYIGVVLILVSLVFFYLGL